MSVTFTKLFSSITESTIWCEPTSTRIVWIAMLAMADRKGRVFGSIPGLANRARVTIPECEAALATFLAPDPYSRTPDCEGRRIEPIDGGWRLINYAKYRAIKDEESVKESKRRYIAERRATESNVEKVEPCRTLSIQAEAEAEEEASKSKIKNTARVPRLVGRFEDFWSVYPCKKGRKAAEDKWRKKKLDEQADTIIADVRMRMQNDSQWRRGYIPYGSTYINGEGWRDGLPPQITEGPSKAFTAIQQALGVNLEAHDASRLVLDCLPSGIGANVRDDYPRPPPIGHFSSDDCNVD